MAGFGTCCGNCVHFHVRYEFSSQYGGYTFKIRRENWCSQIIMHRKPTDPICGRPGHTKFKPTQPVKPITHGAGLGRYQRQLDY